MSSAAIESFWQWFEENEEELFDEFDPAMPIFHQLVNRLRAIHPQLVVDVTTKERGKRELIVSGDGYRDVFSTVMEMVEKAPELEYFSVKAFRPAREGHMNVVVNGTLFETSKVFYQMTEVGDKVDVAVWFIDDTDVGEDHTLAAETILMNLLGEYVYVSRVREVSVHKVNQAKEYSDLKPVVFVAKGFEELFGAAGN